MADAALTLPRRSRAAAWLDAALSALLRYDLGRTDVVKWVSFARQMLTFLLLAVVTIAGLSAFLSTRQAQGLLRESLASEARAIAEAVARASFVPLTLEDDRALEALVGSYAPVERLGVLRIIDARAKARAELSRTAPSARLLRVEAPIRPLADAELGKTPRSLRPIGAVEVGMRTDWIDAETRRIALTNVAVSGVLTVGVWLIGVLVIRNLVDRTRELVDEARLVAEVKRANAELEAFSYSVAHDLRAPLRAIDGFSQILLEEYAGKLDAQGKDFLTRVRAGSRRMGQLIDDLLDLSRIARTEMRRGTVDLSALAREIVADLRKGAPDRAADIGVEDGLKAEGDANLLRIVLVNLLGNAWKYTAKKPRAKIEFGAARVEGVRAFFVRDDGAGFDMAFAAKLFKAFSRLHSVEEFDGTGVGLATVQRVIERHGGRIWGEGQVQGGATFYFTLGESRKDGPARA